MTGRIVVAALSLLGLPAAAARADEAPVVRASGADPADEDRAKDIEARLRDDPQLQNRQINVDVSGKRVRLWGEVDTADERRRAEDLVKRGDPTLTVDDQLAVAAERTRTPPGASSGDKARDKGKEVAHKARKAANEVAEMATDAWITSKIKTQLIGTDGVHASGINVDTSDGVVTLRGNVRSAAERAKALSIARQTRGVVKVTDELQIVPRR